jgi:hypothetical protein
MGSDLLDCLGQTDPTRVDPNHPTLWISPCPSAESNGQYFWVKKINLRNKQNDPVRCQMQVHRKEA